MKKIFGVIFIFVIFLAGVFAADFDVAISNSEDWKDVYSTMLFANLERADSEFLVSTKHGPILLNGISTESDIFLVSSRDEPYVFNYPTSIKNKGFASVEEIKSNNPNLDILEDFLPDITNFIVVGSSYGYNSIAVAPYAKLTNSWVFLADRTNIDEIDVLLSNRNVNDVLIYGYVERDVKEVLEKYNPEIINTGDKFKDNIEIVKKYINRKKTLENVDVKQVVLTNGEFIEKEIIHGESPILFTGKENVPDKIRDYLIESPIETGVLIGNDLIGAATNIKRSAGINVMVKFARGSRSLVTGAAISTVEGLDLFYLPNPSISLEIYSIKYNKATSQLEVTYKSSSNVPAYFTGTINLVAGNDNIRVGDLESIFIAPGDFKTVIYDGVEIGGEEISAQLSVLFGEVEDSLDRLLEVTIDVDIINVIDACDLEVESLSYNKQKKEFSVKVKNLVEVDCWADVELNNLIINEVVTSVGSDEVELIPGGKSKYLKVSQRMDEEDLFDNNLIEVNVYYGERQESLVKRFQGNFEFKVKQLTAITYSIIILIILIILLIIVAFILKKKDISF